MKKRLEHEESLEATLRRAILALRSQERIRLLTALFDMLAPAERAQVIKRLTEGADSMGKAGERNQAGRTARGASPADAPAFADKWWIDPILDKAESSWQKIMENLETYQPRALA